MNASEVDEVITALTDAMPDQPELLAGLKVLAPYVVRFGDPRMQRFISHTDQRGAEECWEWRGGRDSDGYGIFWADRKSWRATRWLYNHWIAPLQPGQVVRHRCDNPPCVNPSHLVAGTPRDNTRDMLDRGRRPLTLVPPAQPGVNNVKAKLTDNQVRAIRDTYALGARQVDLADDYGVDQTTISGIVRRKTWPHIA
jgi:hypothetical protein